MWYLEIEASIGRSLKKAKGEEKKEEKEEENKYFLDFPAEGKKNILSHSSALYFEVKLLSKLEVCPYF